MPSVSKSQQQAAGMALAAKRGQMMPSQLTGSAKEMYDSMTEDQLKDFSKTKHDGLPEKVTEGEIPSAPEELKKLIDKYDRSQIEMGMDVEQEHNKGETDVVKSNLDILKIVLAHMAEDPKYYTNLKDMEMKSKVDESYHDNLNRKWLRNELYRITEAAGIHSVVDAEERAERILEGSRLSYTAKDTITSVVRDAHNSIIPKLSDMLRNTDGVADEKEVQKHATAIWDFLVKAEQQILNYVKQHKITLPNHPNIKNP